MGVRAVAAVVERIESFPCSCAPFSVSHARDLSLSRTWLPICRYSLRDSIAVPRALPECVTSHTICR